MTRPTYDIAVDWAANGTFTDPYDDISADVFDRGTTISIEYGRDQARALAPISAGTRTQMEIDNKTRRYSPDNAASPLVGNVLAGREFRMRGTYAGVTYGLLRGNLEDLEERTSLDEQSVQITVADVLSRLRETRLSTPLYQGIRTGEAIGYLLDAYGWPTARRDLDRGASVLPFWWLNDEEGMSALQQLLDSEGPAALATVDSSGNFVFRDRHHRLIRSGSKTSQVTLRAGGVEPCYSDAVYQHGAKEIINSVTFAVPVRQFSGEPQQVWSMPGTQTLADGETITLAASASAPFFDAVTPVMDTDYTCALGAISVTLSQTSGAAAKVFVTAVGGPAVVTQLGFRAYALNVVTTLQVTVENADSIARVGLRSWPSDRAPAWAGIHDARAIGNIIIAQRADRLPTAQITMQGGVPQRLLQQLGRNLSDRVTIVNTVTGLNAEHWIEQIKHTAGVDLVTVFGCDRVPSQAANVFVLGSATRGVLGTNRLGKTGLDDPATVFVLGTSVLGTGILGT